MDIKDVDGLLDAIENFEDGLIFQAGNLSRIGSILELKNIALFHEESLAENLSSLNFSYSMSCFYRHVVTICDQSLMFFMCSEVSNSIKARPLPKLIDRLFEGRHYSNEYKIYGDQKRFPNSVSEQSIADIRSLFVERYDSTVEAHMLDFQISMFSAFEFWITKISEGFENEISDKIKKSRIKQYEKEVKKYHSASEDSDKIKIISKIMRLPGEFVSFPDKINFIYGMVDKNLYPRDIKQDKAVIDFLRAGRNTVHNGGIHKGNELEVIFNGVTHKLEPNKPGKHEDFSDLIRLCGDLVDIYATIVRSIPRLDESLVREINKI
ncbi:MAG: hypothetical protein ACI9T7_001370 [Oleiphilaceae bacterium]|jgi:hypothetical protein